MEIESKGEEKSFDNRKLMCFGKKQMGSIYNVQKEKKITIQELEFKLSNFNLRVQIEYHITWR